MGVALGAPSVQSSVEKYMFVISGRYTNTRMRAMLGKASRPNMAHSRRIRGVTAGRFGRTTRSCEVVMDKRAGLSRN